MRLTMVIVVAAAGCKQPPAGDCADALDNVATRLDLAAAQRDAAVERCKADAWSPEVTACMKRATSPEDLKPCQAKLTKAQGDALAKAIAMTVGSDVSDCQAAVNGMNHLVAKMCACTSAACAEPIAKDWAALDKTIEAASHDDQCTGVLGLIAKDYADCRAKAGSR
jgi:hypothetical protein